jgi:dTDP-3-amino-3,4,6-trideoxy-alpha-D-glucose transaminase
LRLTQFSSLDCEYKRELLHKTSDETLAESIACCGSIVKPRVLLNDFQAQWHDVRSAALEAVNAVGESGWFILGKEVARFEETLAKYAGVRQVIGCASGLDAIEISLHVLGLKPGESVITTPLSAFATTLAAIRAGAIPVFVDVDKNGLLDLDVVEKLLSSGNTSRFLLPVHLFGHAIDLQRLDTLKTRFGLRVIEDCAQAIGAKSNGVPVGTVGDMSAISFYPTKNLGCMGDGGAIFTSNGEFAAVARALRDYGQTKKYLHTYIGMNSRLDELHAAILSRALLPRLAKFTQRRREIASLYQKHITSTRLTLPPAPKASESVYHLFAILVENDRSGFQQHLKRCGIDSAVHYPILIPDQPALRGQKFEIPQPLPNARRFIEQEVSLPIHPYLGDDDVERVIAACNSW